MRDVLGVRTDCRRLLCERFVGEGETCESELPSQTQQVSITSFTVGTDDLGGYSNWQNGPAGWTATVLSDADNLSANLRLVTPQSSLLLVLLLNANGLACADGPSSIRKVRGTLLWIGNRRSNWNFVIDFASMGRWLPLGAYPSRVEMRITGLRAEKCR